MRRKAAKKSTAVLTISRYNASKVTDTFFKVYQRIQGRHLGQCRILGTCSWTNQKRKNKESEERLEAHDDRG